MDSDAPADEVRGAAGGPVHYDDWGQPVGPPVDEAIAPELSDASMMGTYCRLDRMDVDRDRRDLYRALCEEPADSRTWTYLPFGPFDSMSALEPTLAELAAWKRWSGFTIVGESGSPDGWAAYLRPDLAARSVEVGAIVFGPRLQRTRAATEAMYLMANRAFESGYRRYEWKSDALNAASRAAAERLGFTYEGTFRQATIYKGRNRDTAWYSMIDTDWPLAGRAFEDWLDPANFDASGRQRSTLAEVRAALAQQNGAGAVEGKHPV